MIKKATLLILLIPFFAFSQVGIGTTNPNPSSILDIESTEAGILVPRMTEAQRTAISAPATGLLVYQSNNTTGFWFYNGSSWENLTSSGGSGEFQSIGGIVQNTTNVGSDDFVFGSTTLSGTGSRFFFDKSKGAFRAGEVSGTEWDDANVGGNSIALGQGSLASGTNAFAGTFGTASGTNSIALNGSASGAGAVSISGNAAGDNSMALIGGATTPTSTQGIAIGNSSSSEANDAFAIGRATQASGANSMALGENALASGISSTSFTNGIASGNFSLAGLFGTASGTNSIALNGSASGAGAVSISGTAAGENSMALMGGAVTGAATRGIAIGNNASSEANDAVAIGQGTQALGTNAIAIGNNITAYSYGETVLGYHQETYIPISTNSNSANDRLFVIGNGDVTLGLPSENNAFTILKNGRTGIMRIPTTNILEVGGQASKNSAGDWVANSDSRLKKNIETFKEQEALNKLLQMRGVTYEWNDKQTGSQRPEGIQYGFIAQEIQEVFPENVELDNLGYYQTAYGTYDAMYVQAIKALNNKLESLEAENETLKNEIQKIYSLLKQGSSNEKELVIRN